MEKITIFIGNIIHCESPFETKFLLNGFLIVNDEKIAAVGEGSHLEDAKTSLGIASCQTVRLTDDQLLMPGFVDCHIHASQFPNAGVGYDMQLLDWLSAYTFPLEARFDDVKFAKAVYEAVVKSTLSNGTTTACYFATIHVDSTLILANAAIDQGQRALIGKVNMTQLCPQTLCETESNSLADTEKFVEKITELKSDLVKPILTPRFALNCNAEFMKKIGELAKKHDLHIQTHISENLAEIQEVQKMFGKKYAEVYDEANLLTKKTILAHGVHLLDEEIKLIAARGSGVAHCPTSNVLLQSGICDVRKLSAAGIHVGLGTDVSGGPSPSVLEVMRCAISSSICKKFSHEDKPPLSHFDVFYLATLGGARALALDHQIGNFEVGKQFDAIIADMSSSTMYMEQFVTCSPREIFSKFIYTGNDHNISHVFVAGRRVK